METIQNCLGQLIFLASGQQHSSLSTPSAGDEKKLWRLLNPRDIIQDLKNSCFNEIPDDQLGNILVCFEGDSRKKDKNPKLAIPKIKEYVPLSSFNPSIVYSTSFKVQLRVPIKRNS